MESTMTTDALYGHIVGLDPDARVATIEKVTNGWLDKDATPLRVVAASWDGSDRLCHYCVPDRNGHGQPITTGIHSEKWGEWETCHECATTQLAALNGLYPNTAAEEFSVFKAAYDCKCLASLLG